jgi:alanine racemase
MDNFSEIELSKESFLHNLYLFREICKGKSRVMPILKANAYGHGLKEILSFCIDGKTDLIGVNSLDEALEIHQLEPEIEIMIMGSIEPNRRHLASSKPFIVVCSTWKDIKEFFKIRLASLKKGKLAPRAHLKIDTGMSRLGCEHHKVDKIIEKLNSKTPEIEGVMTHFANIEDVTNLDYGRIQLGRLLDVKNKFKKAGFENFIYHAASSAATLIFPESHLDIVRIGISMYGVWPSQETKISAVPKYEKLPDLFPVLTWKSHIVNLKQIDSQNPVGYGCTWISNRPSWIATIPVGYYEGYPRVLSNSSYVIIRERRAPIVGRICMNMIMADVSDIKGVKNYDEVILIGKDPLSGFSISADYLAEKAGTINYEIFTNINSKLNRKII